jgi:deaminated glutathione amidase
MDAKHVLLRVAAAQIAVCDSPARNLETILRVLECEAARGIEVVVFPEAALSGYSPALRQARRAEEWPAIQAALQAVAGAASEQGLWVALGCDAWEDSVEYDGAWLNRTFVFSPDGELAAQYDKVHLTADDKRCYRPGERDVAFELNGVSVGLQTCYDVRFPEGYRALLDRGARVVLQGFNAAGSGTWKVPVLAAHLRSRAAENGMFLVAANCAGPLQMVVSQIIDPDGLVLAQANPDHEEIIEAELDLAHVPALDIRGDYIKHRFPLS